MRDREKILDIFEESFGSRLLHSYICPGGLMNDIHPDFQKRTLEFIRYFRKKINEYDQLLTNNPIFQQRTKGIGFLSKQDAIALELPVRLEEPRVFHAISVNTIHTVHILIVKFNEILR